MKRMEQIRKVGKEKLSTVFARPRKSQSFSGVETQVGSSKVAGGSFYPGYVELTEEEYARNFGGVDDDEQEEVNVTEEVGRTGLDDLMEEEDEDNGGDNSMDDDDDDVGDEEGVAKLPQKRGRGAVSSRGGSSSSASSLRRHARKENVDWLVQVPEKGGPIIGDMIPSYGAHVAKTLWSDPDARGVLTLKFRDVALTNLRGWELPREADDIINASGLSHLVGCMHSKFDMPLLTAFIERWQPDTNTFHMPFGEMTITMHDVQEILKIPIEGRACKINKKDKKSFIDYAEELIDMSPKMMKSHWLDTKSAPIYLDGGLLIEAVQIRTQNKKTVETNVHGWLMVLLGTTLFGDKTGDRVKANIFPLVKDLDDVSGYAWGAATLAYLYRQLGIASRAGCRQVCGCLTLLQSWIYEHFRCFRPHEMFDHAVGAGSPRSMLWSTPNTKKDVGRLKFIRRKLDEMEPSLVTWLPYCNYPGQTHPNSLYSGFIRFLDVVEPYQPERCMRQFGYTQTIPRPISEPDEHYRPKAAISYTVKYSDSVDDSWCVAQDHRIRLHERSTLAMPCYAVVDKYIDWYRFRTHPLLIDPMTLTQLVHEDRGLTESELLQRTIVAFGNVHFSHPDERAKHLEIFYKEMLPHFRPYLTRDVVRPSFGSSGRGYIRRSVGHDGPRRGRGRSTPRDGVRSRDLQEGSSGSIGERDSV